FVAQFVGSPVMNVAKARISEDGDAARVHVDPTDDGFEFPRELLSALNGHATGDLAIGIRPEGVLVSREQQPGYVPLRAHIIEPLGSHDIVDLAAGSVMIRARTPSGSVAGPGQTVHARIDPAQAHFFDMASGKSLGVRLCWPISNSETLPSPSAASQPLGASTSKSPTDSSSCCSGRPAQARRPACASSRGWRSRPRAPC